MNSMKFAELLCTRLCHDLTGPIGALANGAEFLSEEGFEMQGQAVDLIATSAAQAVARLQFYRRAYGRINDSGEASLTELKKLVEDYLAGSKTTVDWPDTHTDSSGISISYKMGRLLINLILLCNGALLRGGNVSVRVAANGTHKELQVACAGTSVKWDKALDDVLQKKTDPAAFTPKTIQAELTRSLAEELHAEISLTVDEVSMEFKVRQPLQTPETNAA